LDVRCFEERRVQVMIQSISPHPRGCPPPAADPAGFRALSPDFSWRREIDIDFLAACFHVLLAFDLWEIDAV
jgi:hypothetical protein